MRLHFGVSRPPDKSNTLKESIMQLNIKKDSIELVKFVVGQIADLKAKLELAVMSQTVAYAEFTAAMAARNEVGQRAELTADRLYNGSVDAIEEGVKLSAEQQAANVRYSIAEEVNLQRIKAVDTLEGQLDARRAQLSALLQGD
jgi:lactam utilization protein B